MKDADGVGQKMCDSFQGFGGAFGTAGQIEDECFAAARGYGARQNRGGSFLETFAAHFFGDTGNETGGDVLSGFGSRVARTDAGASGCDDQI